MVDKKPLGRPKLGVTKKVSLTLSEELWGYIDNEYIDDAESNWKLSSAIRDMLEMHYLIVQSQRGQIDIYQAILNAQAADKNLTV